ncbi:MAG TPA: glycosyltransferase family 39 protein [Roseiflexaceae bacterium]|nr:glycosyltransferase family 39 protein [Roseiflexaceae bacterium]
MTRLAQALARHWPLLALMLLALGLRLLAWRWHEQYALGGDETEYFNQALTLLRERRYAELNLMRPPLYTGFLAACVYLFDSLVQRLRLVQALVSALTVLPVYALTLRLFGARRVALLAALLTALCYTLAARATELLSETLFLFGLTTLLWLLLGAGDWTPNRPSGRIPPLLWALAAGLALGLLALTRSVALPLVPLGTLWLLARGWRTRATDATAGRTPLRRRWWAPAAGFGLACVLTVAPWTLRNAATYRALILIDTTGAENLWLDNNPAASTPADPLGREAAKRELYALGEDRAARQRLASERGLEAIRSNPGWFLAKAWGEAKRFFALEYFDDMRARRAIWLPPAEVWLRLLLGDALWLLLLFAGASGLWLAEKGGARGPPSASSLTHPADGTKPRQRFVAVLWRGGVRLLERLDDPRWLLVPWALYTLLTAMIFHVELRYRLPIYPVLLPYAAWVLCRLGALPGLAGQPRRPQAVGAALTALALAGLTLAHRGYPAEGWMLAGKHLALARAEGALARGDAAEAAQAAQTALARDPESALAYTALARAALLQGDRGGAQAALDQAVAALRDLPYPHLLRGALLRAARQDDQARRELGFERNSRDDLQGWAARAFAPLGGPPAAVAVGGGLDLGCVRGFHLPEEGFRWSAAESELLLTAPPGATTLELRLAAGRPAGAPPAQIALLANGRPLGVLTVADGWQTYRLPLEGAAGPLVVSLRSDTFRPRDYDRASPDSRVLGVMVARAEVVP